MLEGRREGRRRGSADQGANESLVSHPYSSSKAKEPKRRPDGQGSLGSLRTPTMT
jgi:hypothetical protein